MNEIKRDDLILLIIAAIVAIALLIIPNNDIPRSQTVYEPHVVRQGETLSEIVEEYHGSLRKSQSLIPGNANVIMPGEVVNVVVEGR